MNLILLEPEDFCDGGRGAVAEGAGPVRLDGRRLQHVLDVHRAAVGDELCVGLLDDRIGTGVVTRLDRGSLHMEVRLLRDPPPALPVTLLLALPRPLVLKRVLLGVTAMGVKRIVLLNCRRVEKSFWSSAAVQPESLREQLVLGLEQGRDTRLPELLLRPRFRPFVEDELPRMSAGTQALVAHPEAGHPCPRQVAGPVTLAVGPEGGFIPYEIERLEAAGFSAVRLGERILRLESAIPALLGRLF
jgi:RsmE family RNA methyltransferase